MKERPILFSGPMVRAILEGRKTQTRRVIKDAPIERNGYLCTKLITFANEKQVRAIMPSLCPYGKTGDRLWVRETWTHTGTGVWRVPDVHLALDGKVLYAATEERPCAGCWFPSIHMLRSASRITLDFAEVRVQRIQDISAEDAIAEGLSKLSKDGGRTWKYGIPDRDGLPGDDNGGMHWHLWSEDPIMTYRILWDTINAKRGFGWDRNPWVWAITFKRVAA